MNFIFGILNFPSVECVCFDCVKDIAIKWNVSSPQLYCVSGECRQLWRLAADISDHLSQYIHDHNSQQLHCNFTRLVPGNNLQQSLHSEILNIFEFYKYFWLQIFFLIKISWHKKYVFSDNIVRKSWFLPIISGFNNLRIFVKSLHTWRSRSLS